MSFRIVLFLPVLIAACTHAPTYRLQSEGTANLAEFTPHQDWVGLQLNPEPFSKLKTALEIDLKTPLKSRGEAHVTVITPPEFAAHRMQMPELEKLFKNDLQKATWKPVCIGLGEKDDMQTYFVVVDSPDLIQFRHRVKKLYPGFDVENFYPHVTLGFTDRDLHQQDGVVKDRKSCKYSL